MSVVDILRKYGKAQKKGTSWIKTKDFVKLVSKELNKSERQAYRDIKKAWKNNEILKETLPDRSVLCGLPEFGPIQKKHKGTVGFQAAFLYSCFKNLEKIINENVEGDSLKAYHYLFNFKNMLPQPLKEKVNSYFEQAANELNSVKDYSIYSTYKLRRKTAYVLVQVLVDKVSTVLHEQAKGDD